MTSNQPNAKKATKPKQPPLYLVVRKLIDPVTGNTVGAFVPKSDADKHYLRERGYKNGDMVRAVLTKPRNERFNRLVHGMGYMLVQNIDGYENLRAHDAIKKLQVEAQIHCDVEGMALDGVEGVTLKRFIPRSISYDSMDEHTFQNFWMDCCRYLIEKHWHNLDEDELTELIEFTAFSSN